MINLPKNQTGRGELEVASGCMWKHLVVCDGSDARNML
jgi:hypothetical protein